MLVVADSSPLIVLNNIACIHILPAPFGDVSIPPQVAEELAQANRPKSVRDFISNPPGWLQVRVPVAIVEIPHLQEGERAAISLAKELKADLILIDEIAGRKAAAEMKIPLTGTIGVLEIAADAKLVDLKDAFDRIKRTDFWISPKLLDDRLRLFQMRNA